ncbi:MAG: UvrD-helicase domain-containing protein, partial [Candidatus Methanoperedens sp.]|nr:UvrD-helicase domain-containing protein [Candidatus Methanoperedens sp.]
MVDEFQDTNPCQFEILRLLVKGVSSQSDDRPVMIFADKEQAIYEFRDATPQNVDSALSEFGCQEPIRLTQNHRAKNNDIDALGRLLRKDDLSATLPPQKKYPFTLSCDTGEEAPKVVELIRNLQQCGIPLHQICVIAAAGYRLQKVVEHLDAPHKIPYVFIPSFQAKEVETHHRPILEKLAKIARRGSDSCRSLLDIVSKSGESNGGENDPVLNLIRVMAHQYDLRHRNLSLKRRAAMFRNHLYLEIDWGALIRERCAGRVFVSTIHGVKGLEFEHVILVGIEDGILPYWEICRDCQARKTINAKLREPTRQLHVAVTRSICEIYFFSVQRQTDRYGRTFDKQTTCLLSP